jgi:indole-3-glycerol phosphate synthase
MFLDKILSSKKEEVAHLKRIKPLSELKLSIGDIPLPRNFSAALTVNDTNIIAEIKRSSPSKGIISHDFNHLHIASTYSANGASAISILTDQPYFGGSKTYIAEIKEIIDLPLLRKDFIIDAYQVYETRVLEGDALLLIAGILSAEELKELIALTSFLGMNALVEVHDRNDLDKALAAGAAIMGVNNRDLKTFTTDLNVSLNLKPHVPADKIFVCESGIESRQNIEMLLKAGIHVFLIGETLMRAEDRGKKLQELLGRSS